MPFIITGQISEPECGIGVPNLRIQAWDNDLVFDDKLGECYTTPARPVQAFLY